MAPAGEGSEGRSRARGEDEFELPRVMWVPDSMENPEDFLSKTRKHDTVHAAPCTQTTESSRLLRNTPHETPHRKESTTCDSSTGTIFTSGLDHSTPSGRRPTRRIRSLPCPYSASGTTNSSRRSTIDGSASRRVGSVPASSTRTRDREPLSVDPSSIGSSAGSPSDRLGSLMTQLGERFSNRNEARKRRAEMQDKLAHQKRQAEAGRVQRARQEAEERERLRSKHGHPMGSELQRRPQAMAVQRQVTVQQQIEPRCGKDDSTRSGANAHDKADIKIIKPRHPLAQSDVNHMTNTVNPLPCPTASVGLQTSHGPENTSSSKRPPAHLARTIAPPDARSPASHLVPTVASRTTTTTHKAYQGQLSVQRTLAAATSRTTATISKQHVNLAPDHPVIISEPDTDTGHHQHSDTSFDSLTDMDGLFSAGGEEVEALFRACDGF